LFFWLRKTNFQHRSSAFSISAAKNRIKIGHSIFELW
jgi:hypothetical protein